MASKKKKSDAVSIESIVPAPGAWVAVIDAERAYDVAVWADTAQGVVGLVSTPGNSALVFPEGVIGYVQKREGPDGYLDSVETAAERYFDENFEGDEDDEKDENDVDT